MKITLFRDKMTEKDYIYEYSREELKDLEEIELGAFKKASELNDKLLDVKIMVDEIDEDWRDFIRFLEDEKISRVTEFRGGKCIDFDEELLNAIVTTLKKSLDDTHKSMNYNLKKISLERVIEG